MSAPRYFVLTAGETAHDAIDFVEARGHRVITTALTHASSVRLYGICEIHPPESLKNLIAPQKSEPRFHAVDPQKTETGASVPAPSRLARS